MPLFPEVRPLLKKAFEQKSGDLVIADARYDKPVNYRNYLERFCKRARVLTWPRLWHNMRMTRQSELMASYPIHTVCSWLGNSPRTALQHYANPLQKDVDQASKKRTTDLEFE